MEARGAGRAAACGGWMGAVNSMGRVAVRPCDGQKKICCNESIVSDREEIAQQMVLAVGVQINATCSLVHGRKFPPR